MNSLMLAASSGFRPYPGPHRYSSQSRRSSPLPTRAFLSSRSVRKPEDNDDDQPQPEPSFRPDFSLLMDVTLSPPSSSSHAGPADHDAKLLSLAQEGNPAPLTPDCDAPLPSASPLRLSSRARTQTKIAAWDVASVGNASDTMVPIAMVPTSSSDASSITTAKTPTERSACRYSSGRDLHETAKALLNRGLYSPALQAFEAILDAQTKRFGTRHASVGAAMHNVGVCHLRMQHYEAAETRLLEAVRIRRETLGSEHLEVAASLSKLGAARAALHKYDDAFEDIMLAIRIAKDQLGRREHKTVAQMYCHLGCFYYEAGELFAAQATFMEAYEIYRAAWPSVSNRDALMQQMCDTLCNIGSIQNKRRRYEDAILTFTEALDLQRGIMVHDHPRIIATMDNLAYSYSKRKNHDKALHCYKTMLQAQLSHDEVFTEAAMDAFCKQILMYEKLKQFGEAHQAAKDALRVAQKSLPASHKIIVQMQELVGVLEARADDHATGSHLGSERRA